MAEGKLISFDGRMFRILLGARIRMLRNGVGAAPLTHKLIIGGLVFFGALLFAGLGIGCAALVLIMQGTTAHDVPLSPPAAALVGHVYQYLFYFLLAGSVPYVASSLFQDSDLPLLLTTPASSSVVVAAKMIDAVVANSSQFFVIGVPVLVGLGWGIGLSGSGWAWLILTLLLILVLTPSLTGCLLLILARVFGMRRVRFVVMLVSVVLALSITLFAVAGASRATAGGAMDYHKMRAVLMEQSGQRSTALTTALQQSLHGAAPVTSELSLRTAGSLWMPSTWAATVELATAEGRSIGTVGLEGIGLLIGATTALLLGCVGIGGRVLSSETILEQQDLEGFARKERGETVLRGFPLDIGGLLMKDLRYVGRDTILLGQIGTTLILFLVPFVLKVTQPDLNTTPNFDMFGDLTRLMICLITFMITSIIGLTSVGLEGRGVWLVLSSPMTRRSFLRSKWMLSFTVSFGITCLLMMIAMIAWGWDWYTCFAWLGILGCVCFALTGLAVGLGGLFPRFLYDNPAHRASVWAMILGFVLSTAYVIICGVDFLLVWVAAGDAAAYTKVVQLIGVAVFVCITVFTGLIPVRLAQQRLNNYEWEN